MNNNFKKIASVFLSLLVTVSTFCFTVEKHFCGDNLVAVSYLGDAESCDDDKDIINSLNCCNDEITHLEGQVIIQKNSLEENFSVFTQFLIPNVLNDTDETLYVSNKITLFDRYSPPKLTPDLGLLQAVFII